jgi:hypothetical protein
MILFKKHDSKSPHHLLFCGIINDAGFLSSVKKIAAHERLTNGKLPCGNSFVSAIIRIQTTINDY